jgi:hypothetical protein
MLRGKITPGSQTKPHGRHQSPGEPSPAYLQQIHRVNIGAMFDNVCHFLPNGERDRRPRIHPPQFPQHTRREHDIANLIVSNDQERLDTVTIDAVGTGRMILPIM